MTALNPPRLALWLLEQWLRGPKREPLIGDLVEHHGRGRSAMWFWRQTFRIMVASVVTEIWQCRGLALAVAAVGACLPQIYTSFLAPHVVRRVDGWWFPHLIDSPWSWMVTNPWAYRLGLSSLTTRIAWCALLLAIVWTASRLRPRQRDLVIALFLVIEVGQCVPYAGIAWRDWLQQPHNSMWLFNALWFSAFAFVAIPFSILLGGLWGARQRTNL